MNERTFRLQMAIGIILILIIGITPKIVGLNLRESTVDNLFALIPPETLRQMEINETRFESGWFSSNAEFEVAYYPLGIDEAFTINLAFDFSHGPLMLTNDGIELGLAHAAIVPSFNSREITEALSSIPFDLPQVELALLAGFDQSLTIDLNISGVEIEDPSATVSFEGLVGSLHANPDQSAELQMVMGGLRAEQTGNGMGFNLQGIDLQSETEQMNDLLAPSQAELNIPGISSAGPLAFTATDISADSRLTGTPNSTEQIDVYQRLQVANLQSELPLQAMGWTIEVNQLSTELIRRYYELLSSLQDQINAGGTGAVSMEELSQQLALILVQNSLIFNNYLTATVYQGDHSLDVLTQWEGLPAVSDLNELTIEEIVTALNLQINMSLDMEAVLRSPFAELVDPYVQQGYIQLDNGRILMELTLADDEFIINGSSTSLDQFFPTQDQ